MLLKGEIKPDGTLFRPGFFVLKSLPKILHPPPFLREKKSKTTVALCCGGDQLARKNIVKPTEAKYTYTNHTVKQIK